MILRTEAADPAGPSPAVGPREAVASARIRGAVASGVLGLLSSTWRVTTSGLDRLDARLDRQEPTLAVFWHGKYVPLAALLRGRSGVVFSSASRRGDVIVDICRRFGYRAVQIPDHGGDGALATMRGALRGSVLGALAVDGPRGPFHAVKRGAVQLASDLGFVVLPISMRAARCWVVGNRWDRMEIPYPFSAVHLAVGEPLAVPPGLATYEIQGWSAQVKARLDAVDRVLASDC